LPVDRARLIAALDAFREKTLNGNWKAQRRILTHLVGAGDADDQWFYHVTDDVFRCALCGIEGAHAPECLSREFAEIARTL
jgi:hypothetical protein